jgi:Coenzyme PQQ synthesis protein D (PqqD)
MSDIRPLDVLRRRSDVRFRVIEDEGVVVRQAAAEVLVLNAVATRILALADGEAPVSGWIEVLLAEFEVERSDLERDVLFFAGELVEQGLLEPATGASPRPAPGNAP